VTWVQATPTPSSPNRFACRVEHLRQCAMTVKRPPALTADTTHLEGYGGRPTSEIGPLANLTLIKDPRLPTMPVSSSRMAEGEGSPETSKSRTTNREDFAGNGFRASCRRRPRVNSMRRVLFGLRSVRWNETIWGRRPSTFRLDAGSTTCVMAAAYERLAAWRQEAAATHATSHQS